MESVWDYPRPPRVEPSAARVVVELDGQVLADTRRSLRVLETSHPPVFYIPAADVRVERLRPSARRPTFCEFKVAARYYDAGDRPAVAWSYDAPSPGYEAIGVCCTKYGIPHDGNHRHLRPVECRLGRRRLRR